MVKDSGMTASMVAASMVVLNPGSVRLFDLALGQLTTVESFVMTLASRWAFGPRVGSFGLTLVRVRLPYASRFEADQMSSCG